MRLDKLRSEIRKAKGVNPSIQVEIAPGHFAWLPLQKTPFVEALGDFFDRGADTGITFDPKTGQTVFGGAAAPAADEEGALWDL